jgi:hypothetical protein
MAAIPSNPLPITSSALGGSARAASPVTGVPDVTASSLNQRNSPRQTKRGSGTSGKTLNTMSEKSHGLIRIASHDEMLDAEKKSKDMSELPEEELNPLAALIRNRFEKAVRHRRTVGIDDEFIRDMRSYNGQYDPAKLQEINKFGGSAVYTRMMTMKCRGATALLRNVYMNSDRAWTIEPTPDPEIRNSIDYHIKQLVMAETAAVNKMGQVVDQNTLADRIEALYDAAKLAERRKAAEEAVEAGRKIDDILTEGGFYKALSDFLVDLPIYKHAIIKGPVTRTSVSLKWKDKKPVAHHSAKFFWERVSPWDVWTTPGATDIENTDIFERQRLSVNDLYQMIGLQGYREEDIREIIGAYEAKGFKEWIQLFDYERAYMEGRNNILDDTFINAIEFNGFVQGKYLIDFGIMEDCDPDKPYFITAWMVDKRIFKVMMNPSPRQRVPYYITSFDKTPGSITGNGIPALANDITDVMNATLRSLVNNISISSGPQVVIDRELVGASQNDDLYPWKRWSFVGDPSSPNRKPVDFFQPQSNAQELLGVFDKFSTMLDDVSTIPRYLTGGGASGGAGRTASGLSMLINNANKTLQNVADNIDNDIMRPLLQQLYDYLMLTDDTGMLRGDENIVVDGVRQASKQEQDLVRQLEFLQLINNPTYQTLIGPDETARILQKVADGLGMEVKINQPGDPAFRPPGLMPGIPSVQGVSNVAMGEGAGPNPTGQQTPGPNPAMAAPGAGGVPGVQPAPMVQPVNTVSSGLPAG